jgi:NAD(P)-dependent dehydrogenase (short-subunit alcohol dehydrogenase family)
MGRFDNKVILITGSGSGMGRQAAYKIAKENATVIVADINEKEGQETVNKIVENDGNAFFIKVNISSNEEVKEMISTIVDNYGRLDIAINNAGVEGIVGELIEEISEESFDRLMGINVKGTWLCLQNELKQMKKQGFGTIVNVASVLGTVGIAGFSSYVTSKHAVVGMTKCAALENATLGIRVNACCPAAVRTPMLNRAEGIDWDKTTPMQRVGTVEEVANAIMFLASDESSFTTGHTLLLDGGIAAE